MRTAYFICELSLHNLLCPLCIRDNLVKARMHAQETISERQRVRTRRRALLYTLCEVSDPNLYHPAVVNASQRFWFAF
jgi:hypothetical protein